jgi:hypothetical protein
MSSRFLHVVAVSVLHCFFWLNQIFHWLNYCVLVIHSRVHGHLDCSYVLAVMGNVALDICTHLCANMSILWIAYTSQVHLLGHCGNLTFLGNTDVFHSSCTFLHPHQQYIRFLVLHDLTLVISWVLFLL